MARPRKTGLDYFPMDVDFFSDDRIFELTQTYGPKGHAVYLALLTEVYREGYYLDIPLRRLASMIIRNVGGQWVGSIEEVQQIIDFFAAIGLLHGELYSQGVVTSLGMQRRYAEVTSRRKSMCGPYWLLDERSPDEEDAMDEEVAQTLNAPDDEPVKEALTPVIAAETPVIEPEAIINANHNPTNKRKENQTKQEEIKSYQNQIKSDPTGEVSGAEIPAQEVEAVHDRDDEMMDDVIKEFVRIRIPTQMEKERLSYLCSVHGRDNVLLAVEETVRRGGKALGYVEKVLATMAGSRRTEREELPVWREDGRSDAAEDRIISGVAMSEREYLMDQDWLDGLTPEELERFTEVG